MTAVRASWFFVSREENILYIKLAERLLGLEPALEAYFHRPPFIDDLRLVDVDGTPLEFDVTTSAERLEFHTSLGDFQLVFQDSNTLAFGLPPDKICGLHFRVRKEYCLTTDTNGELKAVRQVDYASNCPVVRTRTAPAGEDIDIELIVESQEDSTLMLHISPIDDFNRQVPAFSVLDSQGREPVVGLVRQNSTHRRTVS